MQFCGFSNVHVISVNIINDFVSSIHLIKPYFYASVPKVPEAFRVVRPSVRPDLRPDFFVNAITQVLLDGISSNLVQGCTTRSR